MSAISEGFVAVARVSDLAPGEMKFVAVERERVVLANVDGGFYALRDVCGHRNAPLSRGRLEGCLIECPLHFAQFDIRTGALDLADPQLAADPRHARMVPFEPGEPASVRAEAGCGIEIPAGLQDALRLG